MKIHDPVHGQSAEDVNNYVHRISGVDVFSQHLGQHPTIIAWFLAENPTGNSAQLIQWYRKQCEDEPFQRALRDL